MWFFFSILALALPLLGMALQRNRRIRDPWLFSVGSFMCFAIVCMDELFTVRRRCFSGDFGGIEDTIGAVLLITGALAVTVVLLNALLLALGHIDRH